MVARPAALALGILIATLAVGPALAKDPIVVVMDRAKVMRLSAPAETIIVGNPAIADATLQDRNTLVLTGRMAGITNLVILDNKGQPVADETITVEKIQSGLVTVQRNVNRYSYNCTPNCNSMVEPGDESKAFNEALQQLKERNQMGASLATGPTP